MAALTSLPEDIIHEILRTLPDLATLAAAIKVSKAYLYDVFMAHRRFILYTVASNLTHGYLPQALKLVHLRLAPKRRDVDYTLMSPDAIMGILPTFTMMERTLLERINHTVTTLEAVFSQTYKDRQVQTSALSSTESNRFKHALYFLWYLCYLGYVQGDDDEFELDPLDDQYFVEVIKTRIGDFTKAELADFFDVTLFIQKMRIWARRCWTANEYPLAAELHVLPADAQIIHSFLGLPDQVLSFYMLEPETAYLDAETHIDLGSVVTAVSAVSTAKGFKQIFSPLSTVTPILLEEVKGAHDTCARCKIVWGVSLYGPQNWHLLPNYIPFGRLCTGLEGRLFRNVVELRAIGRYLQAGFSEIPIRLFDWPQFVEEIFNLPRTPQDEDDEWDKNQWYCQECMVHLLRSRFGRWWFAKKREKGMIMEKDCDFGYDCRTQVYDVAHAQMFNHLCAAMKGNAALISPLPQFST